MKRTKLVCTMGPSCEEEAQIRGLLEAGMSVARFNFSHGTHEEHRLRMERVRQVAEAMRCPVALMLDTKGPEIRTGLLEGKQVILQEGASVVLTGEQKVGNTQEISVSYAALADDLHPGDHLLIDDGLIDLEVRRLEGQRIYCIVRVGGVLGEQKGVNVPRVTLHLPSLTEKDVDDLRFGVEMGVDFIAASFVRQARDVFAIRRFLEELKSPAQIIAKIENLEGFEHLDEILAVADGLMVARGDLGVEVPAEEVPIMQKEMITKCNRAGKPVITATQMLDSMQRNPRPTRAEASDVANAIFDGTDATMLSGESAAGKYPVEAARTMMRIAQRAEEAYFGGQVSVPQRIPDTSPDSTTEAIGRAVAEIADQLGASAIVSSTESGYTPRMVAKYRPKVPIVAATPSLVTFRQLGVVWGVLPVLVHQTHSTDEMFDVALHAAMESGYIAPGDLVVLTAGVPIGHAGTTNLLEVQIAGEVLAQGTGVGKKAAHGPVFIWRQGDAPERFPDGSVLVINSLTAENASLIKRACAIIAEEGGLSSPAVVGGISAGIPVVVGVQGATQLLSDGDEVTVDPVRGFVYKGRARAR